MRCAQGLSGGAAEAPAALVPKPLSSILQRAPAAGARGLPTAVRCASSSQSDDELPPLAGSDGELSEVSGHGARCRAHAQRQSQGRVSHPAGGSASAAPGMGQQEAARGGGPGAGAHCSLTAVCCASCQSDDELPGLGGRAGGAPAAPAVNPTSPPPHRAGGGSVLKVGCCCWVLSAWEGAWGRNLCERVGAARFKGVQQPESAAGESRARCLAECCPSCGARRD